MDIAGRLPKKGRPEEISPGYNLSPLLARKWEVAQMGYTGVGRKGLSSPCQDRKKPYMSRQ